MCIRDRDITVQRTQEGLKAARARGRKGGRPKANSQAVERAVRLYDSQTQSIKEITEMTGISSATLYRAIQMCIRDRADTDMAAQKLIEIILKHL